LILLPVHTYKQPRFLAKRGSLKLLLLAAVAILLLVHVVLAADAGFGQPDVLILVMGGMGPYDQCAINYNSVVDLKTAQTDLDTVAKLGDWRPSNEKGETKSSGGPKPIPTTSITWQAQGIIGYSNGTLPLEPFVTAFKRFKYIEVDYIVPSSFRFRGLKDFNNRFVNVQLSQPGNSYRYRVVVKDDSFTKLDLPLVQPAEAVAAEKPGMSAGTRAGLALGIGVLAAVLVFFGVSYLSKRR